MAETGVGSAQVNATYNLAPGVATRILSVNATRNFAILQNNDPTNPIYVNFGMGAVANQGVLLTAFGGAVWLGRTTDFPYVGEVWAISPLGAQILVTEVG